MKCEIIEEKIIQILEGENLSKETFIHIEKCSSCKNFYNYITLLKNEIIKIEKFEPSFDFEERLISLILKESNCLKISAFLLSSFIFLSILFLLYSFKKIIMFVSKMASLFKILSSIFELKTYYIITPVVFTFIITDIIFLFILGYLLKKVALKEVKL